MTLIKPKIAAILFFFTLTLTSAHSVQANQSTTYFSPADEWKWFLQSMDTNKDSYISREEYMGSNDHMIVDVPIPISRKDLEEGFVEMDANHDLLIDESEYIAIANQPVSDDEVWSFFIDNYDTDKDGVISSSEFFSVGQANQRSILRDVFVQYDQNTDKQITKEEYLAAEREMAYDY